MCVSPILFETRASSSIIFIQRCTQVTGSEHNYHVRYPSEIGLLLCHSPGLLSSGERRINFLEYSTRSLSLTSWGLLLPGADVTDYFYHHVPMQFCCVMFLLVENMLPSYQQMRVCRMITQYSARGIWLFVGPVTFLAARSLNL